MITDFFNNIFGKANSNNFSVYLDHEFARSPSKAYDTDAGWDLSSCEHQVIPPKQWRAVDTGLIFVIPTGWEIQIRPRSGLALKKGIAVLNGPGTIDCQYRNRVKVILYNAGEYDFDIHPGDRIAQAVMCPVFDINMSIIKELPQEKTQRDKNGFGSSGT